MRGPTLSFAPTKTYGPISVNLREKLKLISLKLFFSLLSRILPFAAKMWPSFFDFPFFLIPFIFFLFLFFLNLDTWLTLRHVSITHSGLFLPKTIYFSSVQFILTELSSSHFMTFEIFVKISSLELLATYYLENRKNIPTV